MPWIPIYNENCYEDYCHTSDVIIDWIWQETLISKEVNMSRKTKHTKSRRRRKIGSKKRRLKKKAKKQK